MRTEGRHLHILVLLILCGSFVSCEQEHENNSAHYFLKGYDDLEFRDINGTVAHPSQYIRSIQRNGQRMYQVIDSSLTLVNKRTGKPYNGYIRTFHRDRYNLNLQGEFDDGKMHRLRYWHSNRTLGMDANYRAGTKRVWDIGGNIMIESNEEETYYYYPGSSKNLIKEIISDTMRSYFDKEGNLGRYTKYIDTASIHYYSSGQKRALFPYKQGVGMHGLVKEWYPNGQLKVEGRYKNGKQVGTWIKYDSLGNVEDQITY